MVPGRGFKENDIGTRREIISELGLYDAVAYSEPKSSLLLRAMILTILAARSKAQIATQAQRYPLYCPLKILTWLCEQLAMIANNTSSIYLLE